MPTRNESEDLLLSLLTGGQPSQKPDPVRALLDGQGDPTPDPNQGLSMRDVLPRGRQVEGRAQRPEKPATPAVRAPQTPSEEGKNRSVPAPVDSKPGPVTLFDSLLEEAKNAKSPAEQAAFQAKLREWQHGSNHTPEERVAATQFRNPDVNVTMQEDGIMSFDDMTRPEIKDPEARKAVEKFRAQATILSPGQSFAAASEDESIAFTVAGNAMKRRANQQADEVRKTIFEPTQSKSKQAIQTKLHEIRKMSDRAERNAALASMRPSLVAYKRERQAEIKQDVYGSYQINELQQALRQNEQLDRADPNWEQFRMDSPATRRIRNQLRTVQQDSDLEIQRRLESDPELTSMQAVVDQTESLVELGQQEEGQIQLTDLVEKLPPESKKRVEIAFKGNNPGSALNSTDIAKQMKTNPEFYKAVQDATPEDFIANMSTGDRKWKNTVMAMEREAGVPEEDIPKLLQAYNRVGTSVRAVLLGPKLEEDSREYKDLSPAMQNLYKQREAIELAGGSKNQQEEALAELIPQGIKAGLRSLQMQQNIQSDKTALSSNAELSHPLAQQVVRKAAELGYTAEDLQEGYKMRKVKRELLNGGDESSSVAQQFSKDSEMWRSLATHISTRRQQNQIASALVEPTDTTQELVDQFASMRVISLGATIVDTATEGAASALSMSPFSANVNAAQSLWDSAKKVW